ncbi:SAV_915 family protein [Streptomyces aureocirculatus]|uniref:SAV_915 family protein n=1 Tax=Streptomyces aureocirculatus TaxID=67275 RepID=UPI000A624D10|nr:SAV_915 family protein [Streptomyces aureocirculatus]
MSGGSPAGGLLYVPVRPNPAGAFAVRTARPGAGQRRVGLAFTAEGLLYAALGETQRWTRLSAPALRALLRPLGIDDVRLDPVYVGPQMPTADVLDYAPVLAEAERQTQWLPDEVW